MSDVIPTIDVMPITIPSTVRPERSLLARSVSSARIAVSPSSAMLEVYLLTAQRLNGIEPGGAARRIPPKEQSDKCGDANTNGDRPRLYGGRQWRYGRDRRRRERAEGDP